MGLLTFLSQTPPQTALNPLCLNWHISTGSIDGVLNWHA